MWPFDVIERRLSSIERTLSRVVEFQLTGILHKLEAVMSKISEFAAAMSAFEDRQDAAVAGLQGDVTEMKALIEKLQNTPGEISPEDQALLDALQARTGAIADKLVALDAMTPPVVPAV